MQLPPTILSSDKNEKKGVKAAVNSTKTAKTPKVAPVVTLKGGEDLEDSSDSEANRSKSDEPTTAPVPVKSATKSLANKKGKRLVGLQPPRTLETTLFDRLEKLYGPNIKRMLQIQYRLVSFIIS